MLLDDGKLQMSPAILVKHTIFEPMLTRSALRQTDDATESALVEQDAQQQDPSKMDTGPEQRLQPSMMDPAPIRTDYNPGNYDVVCGRGRTTFNHVGNRRFRITISMYLDRYLQAKTRVEKGDTVQAIIDTIQCAGGRFLKQDLESKTWQQVDAKTAKEKIGHALRDAHAERLRAQRREEMREAEARNSYSNKRRSKGGGRSSKKRARQRGTTRTAAARQKRTITPDEQVSSRQQKETPPSTAAQRLERRSERKSRSSKRTGKRTHVTRRSLASRVLPRQDSIPLDEEELGNQKPSLGPRAPPSSPTSDSSGDGKPSAIQSTTDEQQQHEVLSRARFDSLPFAAAAVIERVEAPQEEELYLMRAPIASDFQVDEEGNRSLTFDDDDVDDDAHGFHSAFSPTRQNTRAVRTRQSPHSFPRLLESSASFVEGDNDDMGRIHHPTSGPRDAILPPSESSNGYNADDLDKNQSHSELGKPKDDESWWR